MAASTSKTCESYTHYVAIDFGTAGSHIAFATSTSDTIRLYSDYSETGGTNVKRTGVGVKIPTILLLDPSKKLLFIGNDALYEYQQKPKEEAKDYYLFDRFKMSLHNENPGEKLYTSITVKTKDETKELPAIEVIAKLLAFLKEEFIATMQKELNKELKEESKKESKDFLKASKIKWIVTVPAIWTLPAKQIMKSAAIMAGLVSDDRDDTLIFALEPEAAAIHCEESFLREFQVQGVKNPSIRYLLADCGGGTVDIVVHELTVGEDGKKQIKELTCVHGGALGGFAVNDQFERVFFKLCNLSEQDAKDMKQQYPVDWATLMDDFEQGKTSSDRSEITIDISKNIFRFIKKKTSKSMEDLVKGCHTHDFMWDDDEKQLVIPHQTLLTLLDGVIGGICEKIRDTFISSPECEKVKIIALVGGFATCERLQDKIKKKFHSKDVIIGNRPWFAVLFGAVRYGKKEDIIYSRKMPYTVGVEISLPFAEGEDNESYSKFYSSEKYCTKLFHCLVKVNDSVQSGNMPEHTFRPASESQNFCEVVFYSTTKESVKYVNDVTCKELITCKIEIPKEDTGVCREITLHVDFSGTNGMKVLAKSANDQKELKVSQDLNKSDDRFL